MNPGGEDAVGRVRRKNGGCWEWKAKGGQTDDEGKLGKQIRKAGEREAEEPNSGAC